MNKQSARQRQNIYGTLQPNKPILHVSQVCVLEVLKIQTLILV